MARSSDTLLGDFVTLALVYEVAAWAINWYQLGQGNEAPMPLDLIGQFFGYPGLTLNPVSVTASYMSEPDNPALATESLTDSAAGGDIGAAAALEEDQDDGLQ